jgi:cobalt-zinc-cadmium efflux system membrane fusion protein
MKQSRSSRILNSRERSARLFLFAALIFGAGLSCKSKSSDDDSHGSGHGEEEEAVKGPHGGRLLEKDDFQVEVTIFETGVPPQFRLYVYEDEKPLDPKKAKLSVELTRLGGQVDRYEFQVAGSFLTSDKIVEEPHSFDVKVEAEVDGEKHSWTYDSYEGRTEMSPEAIAQAGIAVEPAGGAELGIKLPVNGRIVPDEDKLVHVSPRYPGIVKEVRKKLGDQVKKDDVLAIIESNANLNRYEIRSLLSGTIVKKDVTVGEFVSEKDAIFVIADLSKVWVDLNIYRQDFLKIKVGQELVLHLENSEAPLKSVISYISPFGSENTQSMLARAVLDNPTGGLLPGLFVSGDILLETVKVPVAIKSDAIQKFRDWQVAFLKHENKFEILILELGRSDGDMVEVLSGIKPGQEYVSKNSFVVKADILKSGAAHDH